jgi:hypothetical protein
MVRTRPGADYVAPDKNKRFPFFVFKKRLTETFMLKFILEVVRHSYIGFLVQTIYNSGTLDLILDNKLQEENTGSVPHSAVVKRV